ncbi:hypothetical protein [Methanoregula sp.]|uniref:hypothetical protein n=1 Tax=Methanoregula sp. TaxID=2052170 RepID=UPI0035695659
MQGVTEDGRSQVCSGQGIQDTASYSSSSVSDDKNLPAIRHDAATLLEFLQDSDPLLTNDERMQINLTARILADASTRYRKRAALRSELSRELERAVG